MVTLQDITIAQGDTIRLSLSWATSEIKFASITAISNDNPVQITAPGSDIPNEWSISLYGVGGMVSLNADNDPPYACDLRKITRISADAFTLDGIIGETLPTYTSGGVVRYHAPVDLTGCSAVMNMRPAPDDPTILLTLSSAHGDIILGGATGSINITGSSSTLPLGQCVYDIVFTMSDGSIYTFATGSFTVEL